MTRLRDPFELGPMPMGRPMEVVDELFVRAPWRTIFNVARAVQEWPAHLPHYRYVKFREQATDGGGIVEMAADRPFGPLGWPTWWLSEMSVDEGAPSIRFRHIGGITKGMDVEWTFRSAPGGTDVRVVHVWDGPPLPFIGIPAATLVIGPVFIHGIASRTLAGLAVVAERAADRRPVGASAD
jgi:ribosome-associated toxin RatA of RatAB toxin-antitoxin module